MDDPLGILDADGDESGDGAQESEPEPKRDSVATQLVKMALDSAELFHDGEDCYATISSGHQETHGLTSRTFKRWLGHLYFQTTKTAPAAEALSTAVNTLSGHALFKGTEQKTYIRVGGHGGAIYLDLCNPTWQVIEVTTGGWRIIEAAQCPVRFRKSHGMLALAMPVRGGCVDLLRPLVNLPDDDAWMLFVGALVMALRDRGPYPVATLTGEQGSGKSGSAKIFRDLIDPSIASLRRQPKEPRDLAIAAKNSWICCLNNLSDLPAWLSDDLCCLSTGSGFAVRSLYSDSDETIFAASRPVVLNGIEDFIVRGDLADRNVGLTLPKIAKRKRRTEADLDKEFQRVAPLVLGALLDAVSVALRRLPKVRIEDLPRMADFATWVEAAAPSFGWSPNQFLDAYKESLTRGSQAVLEAPVATAIMKLQLPWEGIASELLPVLAEIAGEKIAKSKDWPDPTRLGGLLRRLAPNLREAGIEVEFLPREGRRRPIRISVAPEDGGESASSASQRHSDEKPSENPSLFGDHL
jgi:hypothetical protein